MLALAFVFEVRALLRSRAAKLAIVGFVALGLLAVLLGQRYVANWRAAVETARQTQSAESTEAVGMLERGEAGPSGKPWVKLSEPRWQDRYAATRIAREPRPLAGIAAGAIDAAPVAFHIHASADPLATAGARMENPELDAGAIDLVFVLGVLAPLLVAVLGISLGSREQERYDGGAGMARLLAVHMGGFRKWLLARGLALAAVSSGLCSAICALAGIVGGARIGDTIVLIAVATLYVVTWSGLPVASNALAGSVHGVFVWCALDRALRGFARGCR